MLRVLRGCSPLKLPRSVGLSSESPPTPPKAYWKCEVWSYSVFHQSFHTIKNLAEGRNSLRFIQRGLFMKQCHFSDKTSASTTQKFRSSLFKGLRGQGAAPLVGGLEGNALQDYQNLPSLAASSMLTATATVAPTIGLLPMPMRPIISTCAGTELEPANCASECIRPIVSVIP